jgi:intein/homing endonuclease
MAIRRAINACVQFTLPSVLQHTRETHNSATIVSMIASPPARLLWKFLGGLFMGDPYLVLP